MKYTNIHKYILIIAVIAILSFAYYALVHKGSSKIIEREELKSTSLRVAITNYIMESGDEQLTFGGQNSTINVDLLIIKLQKKSIFNGKEYGPFLENLNHPNEPDSGYYRPYKETEIIIHKNLNDYNLKVYVGPAENKDIIQIIE